MNASEEHIAISRSARMYLFGDVTAAREVWIVCHGYAQLASRFIGSFECIAAPHRLIVAPEGLHRFYLDPVAVPAAKRRVGATWMTREDRERDIADYVAYLDRVVGSIAARARGPLRICALGFSQGVATAFRWSVLGRTSLSELVLWAGAPPDDVDMSRAAPHLATTRVTLVHGRNDEMVSGENVRRAETILQTAGIRSIACEFDGGHEMNDELLMKIVDAD